VVFLPLRLLAKGLETGAAYVGPRYLEPKPNRPPKQGLAMAPYITPGAPSDFGVGPSLTWIGFPTAGSKLQLAGSWSMSDRRHVRFIETIGDRRPVGLRLGVKYDYKPDRPYYGIGNDTPVSDLAYYRLETTNAEAAVLLGASPLRQLRLAGGYSSMSPRRGYNAAPLLEKVFATTEVPYQRQTTQELWYGVSADLAAIDDDRDPSRGVHGRVDLRRATGMESSAPDYTQWWVEGRAYVPVFASRRVIAVRGVYTGVEPSGGGATALPYYRLALSEGAASFAGYASGRFRDRQLLLARAEYRWTILHGMSAIALYELGEVAPSAASFRLRDAHTSYGGGLRLGMSDDSALRFELAKSVEGLHAVLTLGSDF
jgi:outer membrane protein assembly factor BamA